jgi:PAT family beta-lactamase induction signal transducer AmpG
MFILCYKLGDMALGRMVMPFWLSAGLSTSEIGLITGTFGVASSILGGLAGGLFMARYGIFNGLWVLGALQSVSNLMYVGVAVRMDAPHEFIYLASIAESFCGGLGSAAFLAFLMCICRKEYSATQYALISALFRVTGIAAQSLSGWAASHLGYAQFFFITFLLSLPAFLFIFHARKWIPRENRVSPTRDA